MQTDTTGSHDADVATATDPVASVNGVALHLGGEAKRAPGSLGALPSIRTLASRAPLSLGVREPDDQGLPRMERTDQRARPWMPWVAGLALLVLGAAALRLFRPEENRKA